MELVEQLVKRAIAGDKNAFGVLVLRYERVAISKAWQVVGDFHVAQDIAQDAFVATFKNLNSLAMHSAFGPWLLTTVYRKAIRYASHHSDKSVSLESVKHELAGNLNTSWKERHMELISAIAKLPNHEKDVVILYYIDGETAVQISDMLNRPKGTITKQLSRAIERLRMWLEVSYESA